MLHIIFGYTEKAAPAHNGSVAPDTNAPNDAENEGKGEGGINLKQQSVLQTKLTKLAIQIGYAGICYMDDGIVVS